MCDYYEDDAEEAAGVAREEEEKRQKPPGQISVLIVGKSNSGKSFLTKRLVDIYADKSRPVYVVNFDSSQGEICPYQQTDWGGLSKLENCSLIIEDFIAPSQKKVEDVFKILNHGQHHKKIRFLALIGHHIHNTRIHSMLAYFDVIYVSAVPSSYKFFSYLLSYFGFSDSERERHLQSLKNVKEPFRHFIVDVRHHTVGLAEIGDGGEGQRRKKALTASILQSANRFLSVLGPEKRERSLALFDIIFAKCKRVETSDLTVKIRASGGTILKISLVDYIDALVDVDGPKKEDSPSLCVLHDFLASNAVVLPRSYVRNRNFW